MNEILLKALYVKVKEALGEEYSVDIRSKFDNNNCERIVFVMRKGDDLVLPAIGADSMVSDLENDLNRMVFNIVSLVHKRGINPINERSLEDFGNVKELLRVKLINYEANRPLLKDIPHVKFLDLAIVFYLFLGADDSDIISSLVTNQHMELWKVNGEQLYEFALSNMKEKMPPILLTMEDVLEPSNSTEDSSENESDMYVLTIKNGTLGAAAILYSSELEKMADAFNCDIAILPSSIHELILVKGTERGELAELNVNVQQINNHVVKKEDRLSNSVYLYDRNKKEIRIAVQGEALR